MAKLDKPLHALRARGRITKAAVVRTVGRTPIFHTKPEPTDRKSPAQLAWRAMYQMAIDLWHQLSPAEKKEWDAVARDKPMTGYAYFISCALKPNPGIYLPFTGGTMKGAIDMDGNRITDLPAPVDPAEPARTGELTAHTGAEAAPVHGSDSAAAASKLIHRDAAARAKVADPAADTDIDTQGARNTAITNHNTAPLSNTIHNNNNYCILYGNETRSGLPASGAFTGGTPGATKVPALVAIEDPLGKLDISDWYGASGAYIQADADSSATKIEDDDADFPASIYNTIVKWASNAAGTLNTGVGVITKRDNAATLTIYKCTGADFAASYYYWIKHSEWEIPLTGLYLVEASPLYLPAEVDKPFQSYLCYFQGANAPQLNAQASLHSPVASYCMPLLTTAANFTAGDRVYLGAYHTGTSGTPTLYTSDPSHIRLRIFLLKQTA